MRVAAVVLVLLAAGCGSSATSRTTSDGSRSLVVKRPDKVGRWTKLVLSPDGKTYLAQWSGACEIQVAYLVPVHGGNPRPVTDYDRGSAESVSLGWVGRRARVRLPEGQPPSHRPGIYLVDPRTMELTLERPLPRAHGC